jgi:hypothetical protein
MNTRLAQLLSGAVSPGICRFTSHAATSRLATQARAAGWRPCYLPGRALASKADYLRACAEAFKFPSYFGNNWDALEDSLIDLSWLPAEHGYLVLYDDAGRFAAAAPDDFATAIDIFRTAVAFWQTTPTPMAVLLRGLPKAALSLPEL